MERYIGIDVHAVSCTVAVLDSKGKRIGCHVVETNGKALVECLRMMPGEKRVCMEEGTQSSWLYEILSPHAVDVVVTGCNRESRGPKDDERDAFSLAESLRVGGIETRVFKDAGAFKTLRELSRVHRMVVQDVVRVKNRIKGLYRSRGVAVAGKTVYGINNRKEWLDKLPPATRLAADSLYAQLDANEIVRKQAEKALLLEARKHPIAKILSTCPGLGNIRAAQLLPIVVTPHRFRTKRQFWSYCGLGIVMRSSSDWVQDGSGKWKRGTVQQTRGLNFTHNHHLKAIFKGAATTVVMQLSGSPLHNDYTRLTTNGTKPTLAKVSLARKIAAIALAMWKTQEAYDPVKFKS